MMRILLAARVADIDAIDTPYFDIKRSYGSRENTQQAKDMGYDGKAMIHPSQVEVVDGSLLHPKKRWNILKGSLRLLKRRR